LLPEAVSLATLLPLVTGRVGNVPGEFLDLVGRLPSSAEGATWFLLASCS